MAALPSPHHSWLIYHPQHQTLVCCLHGYALLNLASHLKSLHPDLARPVREAIVADYSTHKIQPPPDAHFRHGPSNPRPPLNGLSVRRGWSCNECHFLTTNRKRLRVHYNQEHQTRGKVPQEPAVRLQTLFTQPPSAIHYFCVTADPSAEESERGLAARSLSGGGSGSGGGGGDLEHDQVIATIQGRWACDRDEQDGLMRVLADGAAKHEVTNWLKRSGWTAHFVHRDLGEIYAISQMPGPGDAELHRLVAATDRMFFDRCIGGLPSMPLMTRLLLASPHPEDAHSRPFGPLQERTSMDRYLVYWKRFLCYCIRVLPLDEVTLQERHGFSFTDGQRGSLEQLREHLQDEDWSEEELQEEVLQVSAGFWMQRLGGDPFESPLWHFTAVLGIDGESGQLRPAHLFTYVLAGLVYVGRALLAEYAIPTRERGEMVDLKERFAVVRNDWLCKATYSPMGYTLSLLLYGRKIAQETGSRLMVSWSKQGDMMYFMGKPILMDAIRHMVKDMIIDAEAILWDELMFKEGGDDVRFTIPLDAIEDDLTHTQRGESFVHSNGLAGKEVEMLEDLVRGKRRGEFLSRDGEWREAGIRKYLKRVRHFQELLILLAQMSWGAPARGDEIGGLRLVNGINRDRSAFVVDGEMVLVTQYHKSLAHTDSPRVIPRFLLARHSQLLAMYMIYIRPLTDRWEADRWGLQEQMRPPSDFIWHDEDGPWEGTKISKAMAKWTQHYMGTRLTLQDWRHVAIAISKKHARPHGAAKSDFYGLLDEGDDDSSGKAEQYENPDDLAAAHTTRTSENYGVTIDVLKRLTADSLEIFRQVSHQWHRFLELGEPASTSAPASTLSTTMMLQKRKAAEVDPWGKAHPYPKRPRILPLEGPPGADGAVSDQIVLKALRAVLRDDHAQFRTPQQEEAVRLAAAKETPLVAVLPTGGGKSLVFMVPAMLSRAGVTIVVAPYVELKRQLVTRCLDAGLDCKHWPQARDSWPRVAIVSAEAASSDDFMQWAADVRVQGRLDRVVIDECHLTFTAAYEYREKLQGLVRLRSLGCPFVFLTGTLPPLSQRDFEQAMQLQKPLYIRASSHQTQAQYSVTRVRNGRGLTEVKKLVEARLGSLAPGEKGLIYCRSYGKCKALARLMKCHYYHSKASDDDAVFLAQREAGFQAWLAGDQPYMVATGALGTGIDVPGITHIVHLEAPYSIIDYAQESGRAGRSGEASEAVIVVEDRDWPAEDPQASASLELKVREVNSLIRTKGCRRVILGQCLDNDTRDCKRIGAVLCDNCHRQDLVWKSELSMQGIIAAAAYGRKVARGLERIEAALEEVRELGRMGCRICWTFRGAQASRHSWYDCDKLEGSLTFNKCMEFQGRLNYRKDQHAKFLSCFYCHVSQELCVDGYKTKGASCQWKHIVVPVAWAACHEEGLWAQVQQLAGRELKGQEAYLSWLGQRHSRPVCGQEMTNVMAVFNLVLDWRAGGRAGATADQVA